MKELIELFAEKVGRYPRGNVQDELRAWSANEIITLRWQLEQAEAKVDLFRRACEDLLDDRPIERAFILRKQAEAVESLIDAHSVKSMSGEFIWTEAAEAEAQRLRQQADEAERAGGEM